jgi:hypothetical protein
MNTDYVPLSYENLNDWLDLQETGVTAALATAIGATPAERTAFLAAVAALKAPVAEIVDLTHQLEMKIASLPAVQTAQIPVIRAFITRAKTSAGCTGYIRVAQQWIGEQHEIDYNTQRPTIRIEVQRGRVKITGQKPGFASVNIYGRKKGDVEWKLITIRITKFPYYDERPLTVAGTPEVREYRAVGVVNDQEIGQPSEIKEVVYAG